MGSQIVKLPFRQEKLQYEIEQKEHTYPELDTQVRTLTEKRYVMERIDRNT